MYTGAHGLANSLDVVLDAARLVQCENWEEKVVFRLVGAGPGKARVQRRAREEAISAVQFEAPVAKSKVYEVLQQADATVIVSKQTPLYRWGVSPNKLFDYMASARPVLFGIDTPYDPVTEARAGLAVRPDDAHAMAVAIKELCAMSAAQRWELGLRGRCYVEEHHSFTQLARKLEQVLHRVITEANP